MERYYTYGPYKPVVTVEGEWVTITIDTPTILSQEADYRKTVTLCEKGKYAEAKQILTTLLDKSPFNSEYHRIMGQIRSDEGAQDEAINWFIDALRFRELYGIDLTVEFKATPAELKQAQTFYNEFLEYRDDKAPGEEYELVANWAEDLKMNRFFELVGETQYRRSNLNTFLDSLEKDPLGLDERDPVQEREMKRFLESQKRVDINTSVVLYMVSALKFFANMPSEQVKRIAVEIAMSGTNGFSPEKEGYTVSSIPGKEFSGYQIMAYMYVAWALAIPEQLLSLGLEWHREWEVARKMMIPKT